MDIVSEKFFGAKVTAPALWFIPLDEPMKLLLYSLLFGVIHLFTGLAIKGYLCLKDGKVMDFICDVALWFMLLIGLILMFLPSSLFASIAQIKIVFPEALNTLAKILAMHRMPKNAAARLAPQGGPVVSFHKRLSSRDPWETVQLSRNADRPTALDYIDALFDDFMEFHGDRYFKDDGAIVGGIATFKGVPVTVIGQQKGKNTKDNLKRNFGMPSPDGYRKALRLMKQAETFGRPVICFVDTPGAFCGLEAEERGQGEAIARSLFEMSDLKVPVVSIVIGEGGSGGALAMAVANEVWMMENSIYSVLSPEGFASILWKDSKKAPEASKVMKVTAKDLYKMKIIERVIVEKEPASSKNIDVIAGEMRRGLEEFLSSHVNMTGEELAAERYERFRRM